MATQLWLIGRRFMRRFTTYDGDVFVQALRPDGSSHGPDTVGKVVGFIDVEGDPGVKVETMPFPLSTPLQPGEVDLYVAARIAMEQLTKDLLDVPGNRFRYGNAYIYIDIINPITGVRSEYIRTFPSDTILAANRVKAIAAGVI